MVQAISTQLTLAEFLEWYPVDGGIYELINGEIIAVNPTGEHEEVIAFLVAQLNWEIRRQQLPYFLPRTCTIKSPTPNTAYKPDVTILDRTTIEDEPLWKKSSTIIKGSSAHLVIEVVSTNWRDDYGHKLTDYEALGIPEYWIVDYLGLGGKRYIGSPKQPTVTVYQLVDEEYQFQQFRDNNSIISMAFPELNITAEQVLNAGK